MWLESVSFEIRTIQTKLQKRTTVHKTKRPNCTIRRNQLENPDLNKWGPQVDPEGPGGLGPLAPKISGNFKEKPLFWAHFELRAPRGSQRRWDPWPKSWIRPWGPQYTHAHTKLATIMFLLRGWLPHLPMSQITNSCFCGRCQQHRHLAGAKMRSPQGIVPEKGQRSGMGTEYAKTPPWSVLKNGGWGIPFEQHANVSEGHVPIFVSLSEGNPGSTPKSGGFFVHSCQRIKSSEQDFGHDEYLFSSLFERYQANVFFMWFNVCDTEWTWRCFASRSWQGILTGALLAPKDPWRLKFPSWRPESWV